MVGRMLLNVTLYVHCTLPLLFHFDSTRAEEIVQVAAGRLGSFPARSQISIRTGSDANPFSLSSG